MAEAVLIVHCRVSWRSNCASIDTIILAIFERRLFYEVVCVVEIYIRRGRFLLILGHKPGQIDVCGRVWMVKEISNLEVL